MKWRFRLAVFLFVVSKSLHANIDSLLKLIPNATHDTIAAKLLIDCGDLYEYRNIDSSIYFYVKAQKLCEKQLRQNHSLSAKEIITFSDLYSKALRYHAILYLNNNIPNKSVEKLLTTSLAYAKIAKSIKGQAACYSNLGVYYFYLSLYEKSLQQQYLALRLFEQLDDPSGLANVYMNIANIFVIQKEYDKALNAYNKSLEYLKRLENEYYIARVKNNMAILYKNQKKLHIADSLYKSTYKIFVAFDDSVNVAKTLINLGVLAYEQFQYDTAISYYNKALQIVQSLNDTDNFILIYVNLAETYLEKFDSTTTKNIQWLYRAKEYATDAYQLNKIVKSLHYQTMIYRSLMRTYFRLSQFKEAAYYAEKYVNSRDSLFSQEKMKAIAEVEAIYKTEKQQYLIERLEAQKEINLKEIALQRAENKRQKTTLYATIGIAFLLVMLLSVVAYFLRINQINNRKLKIKNHQISVQKEEISQQRDVVISQKLQLEALHKSLKDSIYYAENIQKAVIPDEQYIRNLLGKCFVLFEPRDIVSGDFYWAQQREHKLYLAVADCTGHGVPGAFMSMMAVSYLNELFHNNSIDDAALTLNLLRQHIIQSLHLNEQSVRMKEGMDMIFVTYDKQTKTLTYAGANNPLYIVRNNELIELEADKMPVGFHPYMKPFESKILALQSNDKLYFTTDGFGDQFGGEQGKKFLRKNLKKLLLSISSESLFEQKERLKETLHNWKYHKISYPQTDDITIIGWEI